MTTTQGAIRRLELLLARTPDMECADDLRVVLADAVLARAELEASESLRSATISTMRRNEAELTEARRLLDDARAQKPVAFETRWAGQGGPYAWGSGFLHKVFPDSVTEGTEIRPLYAAPAPAQPAADVAAIAKAVRGIPSRLESLGGQRFAYVKLSEVIETIYSVSAKQPSAVPDAAAILVQALEEIAWQRPLGVRPSKSGEAMERAAIIALHKYNAILSAAATEVKNG